MKEGQLGANVKAEELTKVESIKVDIDVSALALKRFQQDCDLVTAGIFVIG